MGRITTQEKQLREASVAAAGLNTDESQAWYRKFYMHQSRANQRGLESHLTFDDYLQKVSTAGIISPDQIGSFSGQFNLGRVGDVGNYEPGNCRFITSNENHREAFANGTNDARIEQQRGSTKETSERARKISEAHAGRTKETHAYLAERGQRTVETKSKAFVVTSPEGVSHEGVNLREFCRNNNLTVGLMSVVCRGQAKAHKGWTGQYVEKSCGDGEM